VFQPSVAIGNVGQLAVDLLISTTQAKKCKTVWDPSFIPVVGSDPYSTSGNDIATGCDSKCIPMWVGLRGGIDPDNSIPWSN
jgi:hypothetical protein